MITFFVVLASVEEECSFKQAGAAGFLTLLMTCLLCASVGSVDGKWRCTLVLCACVMLGKCWGLDCTAAVWGKLALLTGGAALVVIGFPVAVAIEILNTNTSK